MPRCTVCALPSESRQKAEESLLAGEPHRSVAKRFGASPAAVFRHKEGHLPAKLVKAEEARELASAESLVDKLERYEREALRLAKKAEDEGDLRTAASVLTTGVTRFAELTARLRGELQAASVQVNIANLVQDPEIRRFLEHPDAKWDLEIAQRMRAMSPEGIKDFLLRHMALDYLRDPAGFLESVRNRAAVEISERRRIPVIEARATVEAAEKAVFLRTGKEQEETLGIGTVRTPRKTPNA